MPKIYAVQIRFTRQQHEQLKRNAEKRGFISLASYIRFVALHQDFALYDKVCEIHQHVVRDADKRNPRKRTQTA